MDPAAHTLLREVLGPSVSGARIEQLLQEAGGVVPTAVAIHFSSVSGPNASRPPEAAPQAPQQQLQAVLGPLDGELLRALLFRASGSVEAAVDLYFSDPAWQSANWRAAAGQGGAAGARQHPGTPARGRRSMNVRGAAARRHVPLPPLDSDSDSEGSPPAPPAARQQGSGLLSSQPQQLDAAEDGPAAMDTEGDDPLAGLARYPTRSPSGDLPAVGPSSSMPRAAAAAQGASGPSRPAHLGGNGASSSRAAPARRRSGVYMYKPAPPARQQAPAQQLLAPQLVPASIPTDDDDDEEEAATDAEQPVGPEGLQPGGAGGMAAAPAHGYCSRPGFPADDPVDSIQFSGRLNPQMLATVARCQPPCPVQVAVPLPQLRSGGRLYTTDEPVSAAKRSLPKKPVSIGSLRVPLATELTPDAWQQLLKLSDKKGLCRALVLGSTEEDEIVLGIEYTRLKDKAETKMRKKCPALEVHRLWDESVALRGSSWLSLEASSGKIHAYKVARLASSNGSPANWCGVLAHALTRLRPSPAVSAQCVDVSCRVVVELPEQAGTWELDLDQQTAGKSEQGGAAGPAAGTGGAGSSKPAGVPDAGQPGQEAAQQGQHAGGGEQQDPGQQAAPGVRVTLILSVQLMPQLFENLAPVDLQDGSPSQLTNGAKRENAGWRNYGMSAPTGSLLHLMLRYGDGLWLGPDCDGVLNLCLPPRGTTAAAVEEARQQQGATQGHPQHPHQKHGIASSSSKQHPGEALHPDHLHPGAWPAVAHVPAALPPNAYGLSALLSAGQLEGAYPAAKQPTGVVSQARHFQLQGLQWMLQRERAGDAAGRGLLHLHPGWLQLVGSGGQVFYVHRLAPHYITRTFYPSPVGGTCGGFLCDEMGLGKSLESLMLILANRPPPGWVGNPMLPAYSREEPCPVKTTLLVMPANLVGQWQQEIATHLAPGSLKVGLYDLEGANPDLLPDPTSRVHASAAATARAAAAAAADDAGGRRLSRRVAAAKAMQEALDKQQQQQQELADGATDAGGKGTKRQRGDSKDAVAAQPQWLGKPALVYVNLADGGVAPIHECDVVIMSYELLRNELNRGARGPLLLLGFWRIMLDEAQLVANSSSVAAVMASSLWRRHAWVVTGTPISAHLNEMRGLCEFLAYEPYHHNAYWRHLLQNPYDSRLPVGAVAFRQLLGGVLLRRTKASVAQQLALPPCEWLDLPVTLGTAERACYDSALAAYNTAFATMERLRASLSTAAGAPNSHAARAVAAAVSALTALRQACCHPQIMAQRAQARQGRQGNKSGRLSMRAIMSRLVNQAYAEFDQAVASWAQLCIIQAALFGYLNQLPGESLEAMLALLAQHHQAAADPDIRCQARLRLADGTLVPAIAAQQAPAGGRQQQQQQLQQQTQQQPLLGQTQQPAADAGAQQSQEQQQAADPMEIDQQPLQAPQAAPADGALDAASGAAPPAAPPPAPAPAAAGPSSSTPAPDSSLDAATAQVLAQEEAARAAAEAEAAADRARRWAKLQLSCLQLMAFLLPRLEVNLYAMAQQDTQQHKGSSKIAAVRRSGGGASSSRRSGAAAGGGGGSGSDGEDAGGSSSSDAEEGARRRRAPAAAAAVGGTPIRTPHRPPAKRTRFADDVTGSDYEAALAAAEEQARGPSRPGRRYMRSARAAAEEDSPSGGTSSDEAAAGPSSSAAAAAAAAQVPARRCMRTAKRAAEDDDSFSDGMPPAEAAAGPSNSAAAAAAAAAAAGKGPALPDAAAPQQQQGEDKSAPPGEPMDPAAEAAARRLADIRQQIQTLQQHLDPNQNQLDLAALLAVRGGVRKSRRQRGQGAENEGLEAGKGEEEEEEEQLLTEEELAAQHAAAVAQLREGEEAALKAEVGVKSLLALLRKRDPQAAISGEVKAAEKRMAAKYHALQHMITTEAEQLAETAAAAAAAPPGTPLLPASEAGPSSSRPMPAAPGGSSSSGALPNLANGPAAAASAGDLSDAQQPTCPICLDEYVGGSVTSCGHSFCSDCIHELVGGGHASCPICRTTLHPANIFDIISDAEAARDTLMAQAHGEYGAKVMALLQQLSALPPSSKALVFSSWSRLLRLVGEALAGAGTKAASLVGGNPKARQAALDTFLHDPGCKVLLMLTSNSSGAAGLTLTVADTVFLMEPALNPALEAQAAARVHRLGQARATRVVRLIAQDTVETRVLALQRYKAAAGHKGKKGAGKAVAAGAPGEEGAAAAVPGVVGLEECDSGTMLRFFNMSQPLVADH